MEIQKVQNIPLEAFLHHPRLFQQYDKFIIFNPFLGKFKSYKSAYSDTPLRIYRYMIQEQGCSTNILPTGIAFKNDCFYLKGARGATKQEKINELIKKHSIWGGDKFREEFENMKKLAHTMRIKKICFRRLKTNRNKVQWQREYKQRPRVKARAKKDAQANKEKYRKSRYKSIKRMRSNVIYRIRENIKERERKALKKQNAKRTYSITDSCNDEELKKYIKDKWEPWMNWDNYGELEDNEAKCWQIDHIKEVYKFDLNDSLQQKACFGIMNIQPLEKFENMRKGGWGGGGGGIGRRTQKLN